MKKLIILLAVLISVYSCKNDDDTATQENVVGTWQLVELLLDPGDGSGTFVAVESDKTVQFTPNGAVNSNGSICIASSTTSNPSAGAYSTATLTITSDDCVETELDTRYELVDSNLIISYPCIERCSEKYIRL